MRSPFTFKKYGQSGMDVSELFPHVGELRRRHLLRPLGPHRHPEPRAVAADDEHRPHAGRPSVDGRVADLRPRQREPQPARLRRPLPRRRRRPSGRRCGTTPSCRRCTRARSSRARSRTRTRSSARTSIRRSSSRSCTTRSSRCRSSGARSTCSRSSTACAGSRIRSSRRRSSRWKSPTGCRPRRRRSSTSARRRKATLELYGAGSTARSCLMAVRLVQRGVRMVQVYYSAGDPWDHHDNIQLHRKNAMDSDRPFAAVIKDLKSRGLLDDTIVVCGSEFGRTPVAEVGGGSAGGGAGRDHNPFALHDVARRRRHQGRHGLRQDRRLRLQGRREPGPRARPARDDPAPARHRPHQADLSLQRPRLQAD